MELKRRLAQKIILNNNDVSVDLINFYPINNNNNDNNIFKNRFENTDTAPQLFISQAIYTIPLNKFETFDKIFYANFVYKKGPVGSYVKIHITNNSIVDINSAFLNNQNKLFYIKFEVVRKFLFYNKFN